LHQHCNLLLPLNPSFFHLYELTMIIQSPALINITLAGDKEHIHAQ
jgi:hypothetical protein